MIFKTIKICNRTGDTAWDAICHRMVRDFSGYNGTGADYTAGTNDDIAANADFVAMVTIERGSEDNIFPHPSKKRFQMIRHPGFAKKMSR